MKDLKKIFDDVRKAIDIADTALDGVPGAVLPAKIVIARVVLDRVRALIDSLDDAMA